jgi:hypothetical protein
MIELAAFFLPFASYHFDRSIDRNEFNPGIAAELRLAKSDLPVGVAVGAYVNSNEKVTAFVQGVWTPIKRQTAFGTLRAGLSVGIGSGYESPLVGGAFVALDHLHMMFIPPTGDKQGGVVAFSFRFDL